MPRRSVWGAGRHCTGVRAGERPSYPQTPTARRRRRADQQPESTGRNAGNRSTGARVFITGHEPAVGRVGQGILCETCHPDWRKAGDVVNCVRCAIRILWKSELLYLPGDSPSGSGPSASGAQTQRPGSKFLRSYNRPARPILTWAKRPRAPAGPVISSARVSRASA